MFRPFNDSIFQYDNFLKQKERKCQTKILCATFIRIILFGTVQRKSHNFATYINWNQLAFGGSLNFHEIFIIGSHPVRTNFMLFMFYMRTTINQENEWPNIFDLSGFAFDIFSITVWWFLTLDYYKRINCDCVDRICFSCVLFSFLHILPKVMGCT